MSDPQQVGAQLVENGMNKNKEGKMTTQVKVSHNILPFGRIRLKITGAEVCR